jgi:hypothetical protein
MSFKDFRIEAAGLSLTSRISLCGIYPSLGNTWAHPFGLTSRISLCGPGIYLRWAHPFRVGLSHNAVCKDMKIKPTHKICSQRNAFRLWDEIFDVTERWPPSYVRPRVSLCTCGINSELALLGINLK